MPFIAMLLVTAAFAVEGSFEQSKRALTGLNAAMNREHDACMKQAGPDLLMSGRCLERNQDFLDRITAVLNGFTSCSSACGAKGGACVNVCFARETAQFDALTTEVTRHAPFSKGRATAPGAAHAPPKPPAIPTPVAHPVATDLESVLDKPGDPIAPELRKKILSWQAHGAVRIDGGSGGSRTVASGTFVGPTGWVLTNDHVIASVEDSAAKSLRFTTLDGRSVRGFEKIRCWAGPYPDLCLIKIELKPKFWFVIAPETPAAGTPLYMIGNTFTTSFDLRSGPSKGHELVNIEGRTRLEVGAPVRPGFSGGPIFTEGGKLVCVSSDRLISIEHVGDTQIYHKNSLRHFCVPREKIAEFMRW